MTTENKILPEGLAAPDRTRQIRWVKAITLSLLSAIAFGITWQLLGRGLATSHNLWFWIWPSLAAAVAVSFLALVVVVDVSNLLFFGLNVVILGLYVLLLPKTWPIWAGGVLFFLFVYIFEQHIRDDEHTRADFSLSRILRSSINFIVYGLLILLGFNIYGLLQTNFQKNPDAVYGQLGNYAAEGLKYVPSSVGNFDPNQSFDDFVTNQAKSQDPEIAQAPPSLQQGLIDEFKQTLENKFHIQVTGDPLLGDVVAGAVAEKIKDASMNYSQFFPAIFALIIVIALRYTAFLFVWLTSIVSWLIYRFLLAVKFFKIAKVQVEVDKLQI